MVAAAASGLTTAPPPPIAPPRPAPAAPPSPLSKACFAVPPVMAVPTPLPRPLIRALPAKPPKAVSPRPAAAASPGAAIPPVAARTIGAKTGNRLPISKCSGRPVLGLWNSFCPPTTAEDGAIPLSKKAFCKTDRTCGLCTLVGTMISPGVVCVRWVSPNRPIAASSCGVILSLPTAA